MRAWERGYMLYEIYYVATVVEFPSVWYYSSLEHEIKLERKMTDRYTNHRPDTETSKYPAQIVYHFQYDIIQMHMCKP